ncbi:hypothetical protein E2605_14815 [Dysgonomonas capnocytophagoides]|uniref:Uncharacterized protein n=1 Tax=Dysgonomonas capnocytophagoides TaxID=45254 RepID=A0A4Y8L1P6_9BACT|nr:hypothetical protein [Dysgonomonas capnocytophagoides]TFD94642.1 hypothetical protein E2605_14815 [Dysgonomonas capnocytophagoides]
MDDIRHDDPEIGKKLLRIMAVNQSNDKKERERIREKEEKEKQKRDKLFQIRLALIFFLLGIIATVIVTILMK